MDHDSRTGGLARVALLPRQGSTHAACIERQAEAEDGSRVIDGLDRVTGGSFQSAAFEWGIRRAAGG